MTHREYDATVDQFNAAYHKMQVVVKSCDLGMDGVRMLDDIESAFKRFQVAVRREMPVPLHTRAYRPMPGEFTGVER